MRKLFKQLLTFSLIVLLIFAFAFLYTPPVKVESALYGNIDKIERLSSLASPKLVVIGGSNVSFGINSKMLEEELGIPTVNMGIHAGVGLKYMIQQVLTYIDSNDIVLISPEHAQFGAMYYGNDKLLSLAQDVMPDSSLRLDADDYYYLADEIPSYVGNKCFKLLSFWLPITRELKSDVYTRNQFNEYGDAVAHFGYPSKGVRLKSLSYSLDESVITQLNRHKSIIEKKGAAFIMCHPVLQHSCCHNSKSFMEKFNAFVEHDDADFSMVTKQEDYVFEDNLFFDTIYHLTEEGRDIRTKRLCLDIERALKSQR